MKTMMELLTLVKFTNASLIPKMLGEMKTVGDSVMLFVTAHSIAHMPGLVQILPMLLLGNCPLIPIMMVSLINMMIFLKNT
jgi:hypothetical protein